MPGRIFRDDDIIDGTTFFEIAAKVYWFSQWQNKEGFPQRKGEYNKLRNQLIEKLRKEYPQMTDAEILNFLKIYLLKIYLMKILTKNVTSEFFLTIKLRLIESVGCDLTYRKQETVNTGGLLKIWVKIFITPKNDVDLIQMF